MAKAEKWSWFVRSTASADRYPAVWRDISHADLSAERHLPSRHSKPFSERKLISFRKANCRKKSLQKYNKHALRSDGEKDQNKGGTLLQPVSVIAGRPPRGTSIHHDIKQFCGLLRRHRARWGRDHLHQCRPQQDQWAWPPGNVRWMDVRWADIATTFCIEYLIGRQSTFAMRKFAACVSALLAFRR